MISGRQALERIEKTVAQLRRDEARLESAFHAASEEAARLREERMDAFRVLARIRLDALEREAVVGELDAAEKRALGLLAEARVALEDLSRRRQQAEGAVRQAEAERHRRSEAVEAAVAAMAALRASVAAAAHEDRTLAARRARLEEAEAVAVEAEKKTTQAEADRAEKGRPYGSDPLFMYLWGKKFGMPEDRSGPLVRFFDALVARLVGYGKARANYAMLNEIPRRLAEHAARLKAEIAAERAALTRAERQELVKAGIESLEHAAAAAKANLDAAEAALADAKKILGSLDREHKATTRKGDVYAEAIEILASADARQDLRELYREALATPTTEDEAIVKRIEAGEAAIGRAEQEMGAAERKLKEMTTRRVALERERNAFRRQGYDSPWGEFGNEQVLAQVLGGILGGVLSSTVLRDTLREGYHRGDPPWDPGFGGGGGFPLPAPPPDWSGASSDSSSGSSPWADITKDLWGGSGFSSSSPGDFSSGDGFRTGGSF